MYVEPNFKSKKAFKEAVAAGQEVSFFQPNNIFGVTVPATGTIFIEGPHFPQSHTWYAQVELKDGKVVKIK